MFVVSSLFSNFCCHARTYMGPEKKDGRGSCWPPSALLAVDKDPLPWFGTLAYAPHPHLWDQPLRHFAKLPVIGK